MKYDKGFTFIETLIVLAIILILSASIGLSASKYIERSRITAAHNDIAIFSNALHSYYLDCGCYPTEHQGLLSLWERPDFHPMPQNWDGPYLNKKPSVDPWGREYLYMDSNEAGLAFSLISLGSDGLEQGEHDDNIYSWK